MAVDKDRIEKLLSQLPEDLQQEVLEFVESLSRRAGNGLPTNESSVHSVFGIWDSGDPHSADNDRIDSDLAREYADLHRAD